MARAGVQVSIEHPPDFSHGRVRPVKRGTMGKKNSTEKKTKEPAEKDGKKRHYPKCLYSRAARELKWRYFYGPALVGIGHPGKPLRIDYPLVRRTVRPEEPGAGWNETKYDPTDKKLRDTAEYRRIDEGFQKLTPKERALADRAFEIRRRSGELQRFFGGLENLALTWPTVLEAIRNERNEAAARIAEKVAHAENPSLEMLADRLREAEARLSDLETWLVRRIAGNQGWAEAVRAEVEAATAALVTAYELVRTPSAVERSEAMERATRKRARRNDSGVPFFFGGPDA